MLFQFRRSIQSSLCCMKFKRALCLALVAFTVLSAALLMQRSAHAQAPDVTMCFFGGQGHTDDLTVPSGSTVIIHSDFVYGQWAVNVAFDQSTHVHVDSYSGWNSQPNGNIAWAATDPVYAEYGCVSADHQQGRQAPNQDWQSFNAYTTTLAVTSTTEFDITLTLTTISPPTPTPNPTLGPAGTCTTPYDVKYDFTDGSEHGWTGTPGGIDQDGFSGGYSDIPGGGGSAVYLVLQRMLGAGATLTNIDLDIDYARGGAGDSTDLRKITAKIGTTTLLNAGSPPPSGRHSYSWSGSEAGGLLVFDLYASGTTGGPDGSLSVKSIRLRGSGLSPDGTCAPKDTLGAEDSGSWAYPVAQAERTTAEAIRPLDKNKTGIISGYIPFAAFSEGVSGTYDETITAFEVFGISTKVNVHSMTDGTVSSVTLLGTTDPCAYPSASYAIAGQPPRSCITEQTPWAYAINYSAAYQVTIDLSGGESIIYIVKDPEVQEGQTVSKGCILGTVLSYSQFRIGTGPGVVFQWDLSPQGILFVQGRTTDNTPIDIRPYLQEEPQNIHCNEEAGRGGCKLVQNAAFQDPIGEWTPLSDSNTPTNPAGQSAGLVLIGGYRQSLNLDPAHEYLITVKAHLLNPTNDVGISFDVQLGTGTAETIPVHSLSSETTVIPAATYTPNASPGLFDLQVLATARTLSDVVVDFICVSDTSDSAGPPLPSACILQNPELDNSANWTAGSGASIANGLAFLPDGGTISQSLMLSPAFSAPQDYHISVTARRGGIPSGSISLGWTLSHTGGGIGGVLGTFTDNNFRTVTDTATVSTQDTYTLEITSDGASQTVEIDKVCITTADGVTPPGYQAPPAIPFTTECKVCSYSPVGDIDYDAGEIIGWLFCSISQIWQCQAKQILMGIWTVLIQVLTFFGFARLWMQYTMHSGVIWFNSDLVIVLRYLNGLIINLGQRIVNAIGNGPSSTIIQSQGTNFWDVLVTIFNTVGNVVSSIKDVILGFIPAVLGIALALINLIASLITLITSVIGVVFNFILVVIPGLIRALLSGISASAATLPAGAPNCSDPSSNVYNVCLGFYVLDNTIWSGLGGKILPLIMSAAGFRVILWGMRRVRGVFGSAE